MAATTGHSQGGGNGQGPQEQLRALWGGGQGLQGQRGPGGRTKPPKEKRGTCERTGRTRPPSPLPPRGGLPACSRPGGPEGRLCLPSLPCGLRSHISSMGRTTGQVSERPWPRGARVQGGLLTWWPESSCSRSPGREVLGHSGRASGVGPWYQLLTQKARMGWALKGV